MSNINVKHTLGHLSIGGTCAFSGIEINEDAQLKNIARKRLPLPAKATTSVASYSGNNGGYITKIWLATHDADPGATYVQITIDGDIVAGKASSIADGMDTIPLATDLLFTSISNSVSFRSKYLGSNIYQTNALGGYIAIKMPFQSSFDISLINTTSVDGEYWSQVFYEQQHVGLPYEISPLRLYIQPFRYITCTYPNEYPLLNAVSENGVFLKGLRIHFIGVSDAWAEGRFKIYTGGPGMNYPINSPKYSDVNNTTPLPYDSNAELILSSSGTEDFFDTSYNWANDSYYANTEEAGLVCNSAGFGNSNSGNTTIGVYRFFGDNGSAVPSSRPDQQLVFSWACGDPQTVPSGVVHITGHVFYYA